MMREMANVAMSTDATKEVPKEPIKMATARIVTGLTIDAVKG